MTESTRSGEHDTYVDLDVLSEGSTAREGRRPRGLARGSTVGRYVVLDRLGFGGMGVVYAAYDPELDRKLALKVLLPHVAERDSLGSGRLLREAQAMAKLAHPNVVTVHDVTSIDDQICIAMEFIEGRSLRQWLEDAPRRVQEILAVFEGAARGLAAAHAQGIVHRDFKPDNVMVDGEGRARVMDFGVARMSGPLVAAELAELLAATERSSTATHDSVLTGAGGLVGTPAYMSPEQLGGAATDGRSDQFAFCVTLWEALYATRPYDGPSLPALLLAITSGEPQTPPRRDVPRWLRDVLLRGLRPSPDDRWPSMEALVDALGRDPTRRRRRIAAVGIAGLAVLGGLGLRMQSQRATEQRCAQAGDAIDEVWNEGRASAIADTFAATGMGHASTSFAKARPWLDAWADSWRSTQDAACRATMLDGERSAELLERSRECLDDRRLALEVLLESFEQPGGMVNAAVESAVSLPQVAPCLDDAWLRRQPRRPEDPAAAQRLLELRRTLARANVAYSDAQYTKAGELARQALASIEALDGRPFEAQARSLVGNSLRNTGQGEQAAVELEAAYFAGLRASDPESAADAAMEMMHVLGGDLRRHAEALHWGRLADVTAEVGVDPKFRLAERTGTRASVLLDHGDYDEAIAAFEQALALRRELLGDQHPFVAGTRSELSQAYLRVGRYQDAEGESRAAIEAHEQALGPSHPNTARVHINLADVLLARGKTDEAEAELRLGLEVLSEVAPGDPVIALAHNNLGGVFAASGRNEEALVELREGLRLFRLAVGDDHPNVALAQANIAALLARLDRLEESEVEARAAVVGFERSAGPEHPQAAQLRSILADTLAMRGKLAEAEQVLREGLIAAEQAVGSADPRTAWYQQELGAMLAAHERADEARPLLEAAWAVREHADVEPTVRAQTAFALARVLTDDPARAHRLAIAAREQLVGHEQLPMHQQIVDWLAAHPSAP